MAVPVPRSAMTAEELFELPDDGGRSELVAGEIIHEDGELSGGDVLPGFRSAVRRLFP